MVRNAAHLHVPFYRHATPYVCVFLLVVGKVYDFVVPFLLLAVLLLVCSYGFNNEEQWPSEKKGLSAYSVFNKNQEELPGTLNAANIDRELRGNSMRVRNRPPASSPSFSDSPAQHEWGKGNKLS